MDKEADADRRRRLIPPNRSASGFLFLRSRKYLSDLAHTCQLAGSTVKSNYFTSNRRHIWFIKYSQHAASSRQQKGEALLITDRISDRNVVKNSIEIVG